MTIRPRPATPRPGTARWPLQALCMVTWMAVAAMAAPNAGAASAAKDPVEQAYRQQRADCQAGKTGQDLATCLKEAAAARAEARRGALATGQNAQDMAANRLLRCQRLPAAQRPDCERLARGEGSSSGSVQGGGVLKTLVTRSVGASAPLADMPAASASASAPGPAASR